MVVQNIDYGWTETVQLSSLYELPPNLKQLPPQVMQAKLAGIQKKSGLSFYPELVKSKLVAVKTRRKVSNYSSMMSFYKIHVKIINFVKYERKLHCSISVWPV